MKKAALDIALHFLKFRPRSVFEIRQKLKQKKIEDQEITDTIRVLENNKLLDDSEFARMYVRDRNQLKPTGTYLLRLELKRLGISADLIEEVLACQDEEELARKAYESKSRLKIADDRKIADFLARRGFSANIIYKVLRKENYDS